MGGSSIPYQPGVYGEKGIASADNIPGSRIGAVGWGNSSSGEFWLFGGVGGDQSGGECTWYYCWSKYTLIADIVLLSQTYIMMFVRHLK